MNYLKIINGLVVVEDVFKNSYEHWIFVDYFNIDKKEDQIISITSSYDNVHSDNDGAVMVVVTDI